MIEMFPFEDDDIIISSNKIDLNDTSIKVKKQNLVQLLSSMTDDNGRPYFSEKYIKEKILRI